VGKEALVVNDFDGKVTVRCYDPSGETKFLRIVSAALGYVINWEDYALDYSPRHLSSTFGGQLLEHHEHETACCESELDSEAPVFGAHQSFPHYQCER
jgi:hypothetical protein